MNAVKAIPKGYHSIIPYMCMHDASAAIRFYKEAFGAKEVLRMNDSKNRVSHAELLIGDSHIMLSDEHPESGAYSPNYYGGSPIKVLLYMEDVDKVIERAVAAGARIVRPVEDQFYGDRTGGIEDPFGHIWYVATHIKDVSPEEMQRHLAGEKV